VDLTVPLAEVAPRHIGAALGLSVRLGVLAKSQLGFKVFLLFDRRRFVRGAS